MSEVLEDEERELAKAYLLGISINRDYKKTFTNVLSLSSSEDSADPPPLLLAGTVDSKKRGQTERNAASSEVKKQKMEGQAQEDKKEEEELMEYSPSNNTPCSLILERFPAPD